MTQQNKGQTVAYLRVSSTDQNLDRQFAIIREQIDGDLDKTFHEKVSGASRDNRPALAELIGYVREGDTVVVASMDRLARSLVDLQQLVQDILAKGVTVRFLKERLTFEPGKEDKYAEFQLSVLGAVAQLERAIIKERQSDGIRAAKERGVYKGRAKALKPEQLEEARQKLADGDTKAAVARYFGVDRSTLYRSLEH
ncbi:recombinase family protein [Sinomonas albida]|uniref:recombinase family protein n=1 Tax=Sinomonas albida TaxID=369942 RepID=UPI003019016F